MRVLSAIQPSGSIHIGNYLGALRNWAALQDKNECFFEIADLHSLTNTLAPEERLTNTMGAVATLLAIGINPGCAAIFVQSQIQEHAQLAWILNCFTYFGELRRMIQFKAKTSSREANPTAGLLTYPVLQAADILLYHAESVPVGNDQSQHLELARNLAERFNRRFGAVFTIPEALVPPSGARIMNLQNPRVKMSKSAGPAQGVILLTDTPEEIRRKVRSAVTDSGRDVADRPEKPAMSNLLAIYSALSGENIEVLEKSFVGASYSAFKTALADLVIESLRPIRESYLHWINSSRDLSSHLKNGTARARIVASATLAEVQRSIGLLMG